MTTKQRPRILVIDDDPLFRSLIVSLLRSDYLVSVASNGSEGFYKALEYPPDAAIVDIQMPEWDGLQTLRAFRGHPVLNEVKVLILTSDASKGTVMAAIESGANDYLIKTGFSKAELFSKLGRLLPRVGKKDAAATELFAHIDPARGTRSAPSLTGRCVDGDGSRSADPDGTEKPVHAGNATVFDAELQELIDAWE